MRDDAPHGNPDAQREQHRHGERRHTLPARQQEHSGKEEGPDRPDGDQCERHPREGEGEWRGGGAGDRIERVVTLEPLRDPRQDERRHCPDDQCQGQTVERLSGGKCFGRGSALTPRRRSRLSCDLFPHPPLPSAVDQRGTAPQSSAAISQGAAQPPSTASGAWRRRRSGAHVTLAARVTPLPSRGEIPSLLHEPAPPNSGATPSTVRFGSPP